MLSSIDKRRERLRRQIKKEASERKERDFVAEGARQIEAKNYDSDMLRVALIFARCLAELQLALQRRNFFAQYSRNKI